MCVSFCRSHRCGKVGGGSQSFLWQRFPAAGLGSAGLGRTCPQSSTGGAEVQRKAFSIGAPTKHTTDNNPLAPARQKPTTTPRPTRTIPRREIRFPRPYIPQVPYRILWGKQRLTGTNRSLVRKVRGKGRHTTGTGLAKPESLFCAIDEALRTLNA